eukprot:gene6969-7710_t
MLKTRARSAPTSSKPILPRSALSMKFDTIVKVKSKFEAKCNLESDPGISLTDYMQLPVDQYVCLEMPLNATLSRIGGSKFNLTVPPVRFFHLDVSPTLFCEVTQSTDSVNISSQTCLLRGSPYVEGLNGCFNIHIQSSFKWVDNPDYKAILSRSRIDVEVDPPAPFKYFGKTILENTGSLALSIALRQIENAFVQSLARDYHHWATSASYRAQRQAMGSLPALPAHVDHQEDAPVTENEIEGEPLQQQEQQGEEEEEEEERKPQEEVKEEVVPEEVMDAEYVKRKVVPTQEEKKLSGNNVRYHQHSEEAPLDFLSDDVCLLPGAEPEVRIEAAPGNARRIYTGVDIEADIEEVWAVLTDYDHLQDVVPSLVRNEVLQRDSRGGARLLQIGAAKVLPGLTFRAKTVLDVALYPEDDPLPPACLLGVGQDSSTTPLVRGVFPRPYARTALPHRDLTMQNVEGEGDFDHYQGLWRVQSLPNCRYGSEKRPATRLSYAVEIRPKGFLPVHLIEGRIARDLKTNLDAIRRNVETRARANPIPLRAPPPPVVDMQEDGVEGEGGMEFLRQENKLLKQRLHRVESELAQVQETLRRITTIVRDS